MPKVQEAGHGGGRPKEPVPGDQEQGQRVAQLEPLDGAALKQVASMAANLEAAAPGFDPVTRPAHYVGKWGLDKRRVIDEFELGYYDGDAVSYILRARRKGTPLEDYRKAIDQLQHLCGLIERDMAAEAEARGDRDFVRKHLAPERAAGGAG